MKKIRSYTCIWSVDKVLYSINDFRLPFPVTFAQIAWFVVCEFLVMILADVPPLSLLHGAFLKYFGIPIGITWFMSQKTFDGKKPYNFLHSVFAYLLRSKRTYAGKAVHLGREASMEPITAVSSDFYGVTEAIPSTYHINISDRNDEEGRNTDDLSDQIYRK